MAIHMPSAAPPAEEQRQRLEALYRLAVEIAGLRDLRQVLNTALRHCLELTASQFGFIGLNSADGAAMDVVAIQGFEASPRFYDRNHLIPLRPNIFARAVLENRPVRSLDALHDEQRVGQPLGHPPVGAFLGVPLSLQGEPIGMIGVANRLTPYTVEHEHLLTTYAAQVAIAIRNAQLYEELRSAKDGLERKVEDRTRELGLAKEALADKARQLGLLLAQTVSGQERERARIAHDMHDGLNQLTIGAILELKAARDRLGAGDQPEVDAALQRVRAVLGQVDGEIKRIIHDLRPPSLDALGLPAAVTRYIEHFQSFTGLLCQTRVRGRPRRLPPDAEIGIYRVMQEALQNAAAHARGSRTMVRLTFRPQSVELEVEDNGQGFEPLAPPAQAEGHLGLAGMRERAENLGGSLHIESGPGNGTRVRLCVPATAKGEERTDGGSRGANSYPGG
ncbi:MAG TPA: GAF domain-containing sensor histidine kinase [Chloroflexota bacterium]|nr:GAF domain-containing sensor histidine kinase [Chloroflexota bacterium]